MSYRKAKTIIMKARTTSRHFVQIIKTLIILAYYFTRYTFKVQAAPVILENGSKQYLIQFGYLPASDAKSQAIVSEETFSDAISQFQSFMGINITGNVDVEGTNSMTSLRCGVKDIVTTPGSKSKRYDHEDSKWNTTNLTYRIIKYPKKLYNQTVDEVIARAFAVWSAYTDLTFSPKSGKVDIEISFESGKYGDGGSFDGPQGTLGYAYYPAYGGDAYFDDAEEWTIDSYNGTNLFQVAIHEFGHSLGLRHSNIKSAIMAPIYRGYDPNFMLDDDDIQGIQAIYGPKTRNSDENPKNPRTTVALSLEEKPDVCKNPQIDTIFQSADGHTYVFQGEHYWKLTSDGIATGYPKLIAVGWSGLPSKINAAFTYNGQTYFFKGSEYWIYEGTRMIGSRSKKIRQEFPGVPNNVDAATMSNANRQIYFYKGVKFWSFDLSQKESMKSAFPKPISEWAGLPKNLDAAFNPGDGFIYFFKGAAYYRFDDSTFLMDPASPYITGSKWFGCRSKHKELLWSDWLYSFLSTADNR